ncbi:Uncharacterised protein [Chryseobacterium gleum]|uniref:Aspartyl protease n=2 Tax=Chryseobacterium gleum TaxID=250 RepID=A0A3S4MM10_CHRGE|nr:hypothetical protein [Chryseobacterium gleum]EFK35308.1 hypothetical protein HMPREF0204_14377 [Chryseobacterium gleum ATCC 35910]QQY31091.1 hypothetical protein I6I60_19805 [Chryseobacterium gleum]VEE04534.1 Uncharacterised protein [Chryseobacterium gleum]
MLKRTVLFTLLFAGFCTMKAQQTIPFRITKHNNIIVKTLVNKKDSLDLMFQIAMKDDAISPDGKKKAGHIIFNKEELSDDNTVEIGKITQKNVRFFNNQLTGHEADGKIGTGIFEGKAFKIDYDNNQFMMYDTMPDVNGYQPINIILDHDGFYLAADNVLEGDQQEETYFVLQSGFSGAILYSNEFAEEKHLEKKLKVTGEKTLKNSEGKTLITKQAVLPYFKLGNSVFKDISVGFFSGELKTQNVSYLGADMLRRFIWIFDADRKTAYIKPSKYFSEPYYKMN